MDFQARIKILIEEIERARHGALAARGRGGSSISIDSVLLSLRRTLAAVAEGYDPRQLGARGGFTCEVDGRLEHTLGFKGRPLPVNGRYLEHLLSRAGVDLLPGQVLLLDTQLAREVIDDAIEELDRDHERLSRDRSRLPGEKMKAESLRILRRKVELLAARFAADDLRRRGASDRRGLPAVS